MALALKITLPSGTGPSDSTWMGPVAPVGSGCLTL